MPSTGLVFCPLVGEGGWMDGGYTSGVAVVSLLCRDGEGVVCLGIGLAIVRLCTTRAIFNQLLQTSLSRFLCLAMRARHCGEGQPMVELVTLLTRAVFRDRLTKGCQVSCAACVAKR